MISIQQEAWSEVQGEIMPLWIEHHREIARDGDVVRLAPDLARYESLDRIGKLLIVTARKDGKLVGYTFCVIDTHLHYCTTLMGFYDIYWLRPELRGTMAGTGIKLFRETERIGNSRGVRKWFIGSKLWQDHSRIFERLGWTETERMFTKLV